MDVALSENPQKYKSETWQHFLRDTSTERAKCRHCSAILKTSKGNTKGMIQHLVKHDIVLKKRSKISEI